MDMPVRRFWFMNNQLPRVQAYESLTQVSVAQCSNGGKEVNEYVQGLKEEMGNVVDQRPVEYVETDEDTKARLRRMAGAKSKAEEVTHEREDSGSS